MILWMLGFALAQDDCAESVTAVEYQSEVSGAVLSFLAADVSGFETRRDASKGLLPCVTEPLGPVAVQATYQLLAFDGFYSRDDGARDRGLRALQDAFEGYQLPSQFSDSHPLRIAWDEESKRPLGAPKTLPVPLEVALLIDGEIGLNWPSARPVLVQLINKDGAVAWTRLYDADAEPPTYETTDERLRAAYLRSSVIRERRPIELVILSGAALSAAGGLYAGHRIAGAKFRSAGPDDPELDRLRDRTNSFAVGSGISAALAAGLGVTAAVIW